MFRRFVNVLKPCWTLPSHPDVSFHPYYTDHALSSTPQNLDYKLHYRDWWLINDNMCMKK